jgi:VWFA-related protein
MIRDPGWTVVVVVLVAAAAAFVSVMPAQTVATEPDPLDVGLEEEVEVQLVLVDFLVLDRDDRTVPDLTIDDFTLLVAGREVAIDSLDRDCPVGAAGDPLPGKRSVTLPSAPTARPRRIVLVLDYYHMANVAEAFDAVLEALDKWPVGGEEHMVVSLGPVVRIESPFTRDLDEVRWTLRRMRNDPDLYAGNYSRLTERRFFDRVEVLFDLLERWEGRKTVVLFSGPFQADGFYRDPEFKRLSALATATRTAVYPVDTGGLRTGIGPRSVPFSGPPMLRRLANETGGRMTSGTNEIGVAYAKAHRDLGCTYTMGFYDPRPDTDRKRRLTIHVNDRRGLRVVYPEFFVVRSPDTKRKSLFRTATMTPQMFEDEQVNTDVFVFEPRSSKRWRAMVAVEVRLASDAFVDPEETWELKGLVRKPNGTIVHSFNQKVAMPATNAATGETPAITLFHEFRARPGRYTVSVVLADPRADTPLAATRPVIIASIPQGEPFLVGPIVGRHAADAETAPDGRRHSTPDFEPSLTQEAAQGDRLDSLTVLCVVGADEPVDVRELARAVTTWEGQGAQAFEPASFRLSGDGAVRCRRLVDAVATAELEPGRYEIRAFAETSDQVTGRGTAEFTIRAPSLD